MYKLLIPNFIIQYNKLKVPSNTTTTKMITRMKIAVSDVPAQAKRLPANTTQSAVTNKKHIVTDNNNDKSPDKKIILKSIENFAGKGKLKRPLMLNVPGLSDKLLQLIQDNIGDMYNITKVKIILCEFMSISDLEANIHARRKSIAEDESTKKPSLSTPLNKLKNLLLLENANNICLQIQEAREDYINNMKLKK